MQLYFPREKEIPSVEMLQKRLNSLREMPITAEDDTEESKSNLQSPMEVQENVQPANDATLKVTPSLRDSSKDSTHQDVPEQNGHSVDLDHGDDQHANGDKSFQEDVSFPQEDNSPLSGDGKVSKEDEEKVDTVLSQKEQEDDPLSLEKTQKDDIPSKDLEKDQNDDLPSLKTTNDTQSQEPSSLKDQLPLFQKDTSPTEKTVNDNTSSTDDVPKNNEEMGTQDVQPSTPMDTSSTDQSSKSLNDKKHLNESDGHNTQLPILQKSVSEPASM